jgi:hypothetical protein
MEHIATGTCVIVSGQRKVKFHKKEISKSTCEQFCKLGKDEYRKCEWENSVTSKIVVIRGFKTGSCVITTHKEGVIYQKLNVLKYDCERVCTLKKDTTRGCSWKYGNDQPIMIRLAPPKPKLETRKTPNPSLASASSNKYDSKRKHCRVESAAGHTIENKAASSLHACQNICQSHSYLIKWGCSWTDLDGKVNVVRATEKLKPIKFVAKTLIGGKRLPKNLPDLSHLYSHCCTKEHFTCKACKAHVSEDFFCKHNPGKFGCAKIDKVQQALDEFERKKQKTEEYHKNKAYSKKKYAEESNKELEEKEKMYKENLKERQAWAEQERKEWKRRDETAKEETRKEEDRKAQIEEQNIKERDRQNEIAFQEFRKHVEDKKRTNATGDA